MNKKKIKILTISDNPLSPSGVAIETNYMITSLLKTGEFQFISLGGAIKHQNYQPIKTEEFGDDWVIYPVDGYGNQEIIRSMIRSHKPDMLWMMTDPRFYVWLFQMENEIRPLMPIVYYHVWDNYPYPKFNKSFYDSCDRIVAISKLTEDVVKNVAPDVQVDYLPHTCPPDLFKKLPELEVKKFKEDNFKDLNDRIIFFFNSRNARRKQSGSLIYWFKSFLDKVGHDKAVLLMHTDPKDPNGQDLNYIVEELGLSENRSVLISTDKVPPQALTMLYNAVDCTVSVSDAEGFGKSIQESLMCETPVICTMTGGMQDQVTDGEEFFGVGIEPASKAIIGSQEIPMIFEDRVSEKDVVEAMEKILNLSKEERQELGRKGREFHVTNFGFEDYAKRWYNIFKDTHKERGSWDSRNGYSGWEARKL